MLGVILIIRAKIQSKRRIAKLNQAAGSTAVLTQVSDRHQRERRVIFGQTQNLLDFRILECADDDGTEVSCYRLQVDVLRGMADFDVRIAARSLSVLPGAAFVDTGKEQNDRGMTNPGLIERGCRQCGA